MKVPCVLCGLISKHRICNTCLLAEVNARGGLQAVRFQSRNEPRHEERQERHDIAQEEH